jgi:hypothetical protein
MEVSGQLQAPDALPPGKNAGTTEQGAVCALETVWKFWRSEEHITLFEVRTASQARLLFVGSFYGMHFLDDHQIQLWDLSQFGVALWWNTTAKRYPRLTTHHVTRQYSSPFLLLTT